MSTSLYRLRDADGRLLYVGIANHIGNRWSQHEHRQPWWDEVASATVEHHPTRAEALAAELEAIATENPAHNVTGSPRCAPNPGLLAEIPAKVLNPAQVAAVLGYDESTIRRWAAAGRCPNSFADMPTTRVGVPRWWVEARVNTGRTPLDAA